MDNYEPLLTHIERPARYVNGEMNARTSLSDTDVTVVLAFPDVYEIGLSYHGFQILYEHINNRDGFAADRTYAPWTDMEKQMRDNGVPLLALESHKAVAAFDLIGFTLQHELNYTNLLNMIDLAGLPLESEKRKSPFPLIIAGGEGAYNPEPLADFIDAFLIGDGEETILEVMNEVRKAKLSQINDKIELLKRLSQIDGVYVPALYNVEYGNNHHATRLIKKWDKAPEKIRKRVFDLARDTGCVRPLVSLTRIVHDRFTVEIQRGCSCGCRFCLSGMINRPTRERPIDQIVALCEEGIENTGYDQISLLSLNTSSHSQIKDIALALNQRFASQNISVSFPSLRPDRFDLELAKQIQKVKKSGLTFAPEAGTERLRKVINKPLNEDNFLNVIRQVVDAGWSLLKLYFMIGLPTETDEDLEGIVALVRRVVEIGRGRWRGKFTLHVTISPFVPKPHTPFQWEGQPPIEELRRKIDYLRERLRSRYVDLKPHDVRSSILEAALARGDRRIGKVIQRAWELGCRFDSWREHFRFDLWVKAFKETELSMGTFSQRTIDPEAPLPWQHVDTLIDPRFLKMEHDHALTMEETPDCREEECSGCGVCGTFPFSIAGEQGKASLPESKQPPEKFGILQLHRFRLTYEKRGRLKYISHLDMGKIINHVLRMSGLHVTCTKGFHPQVKVQYGPPLGLFYESTCELLDVFLEKDYMPEEVLEALRKVDIAGLRFTDAIEITYSAKSSGASALAAEYVVTLPDSWFEEALLTPDDLIERGKLLDSTTEYKVPIIKKGKEVYYDLKKCLRYLRVNQTTPVTIELRVSLKQGEYIEPLKALSGLFETPVLFSNGAEATRKKIVLK